MHSQAGRTTRRGSPELRHGGPVGVDLKRDAGRQGPAARRSLESALLRRSRYGNQAGRYVVLSRHADRPDAAGAVVLDGPAQGRRRQDHLVTPVEKVGIRVVDAPFLAVEMNVSGRATRRSSPSAPMSAMWWKPGRNIRCALSTRTDTGGLKPYVLVRGRLEALVARPVMYELVEHGEEIVIDGVADVRRSLEWRRSIRSCRLSSKAAECLTICEPPLSRSFRR